MVTRRNKSALGPLYKDPFKEHMQKLEDKLRMGINAAGQSSMTNSPRNIGTVGGAGVFDSSNQRNQGFLSVQKVRDMSGIP